MENLDDPPKVVDRGYSIIRYQKLIVKTGSETVYLGNIFVNCQVFSFSKAEKVSTTVVLNSITCLSSTILNRIGNYLLTTPQRYLSHSIAIQFTIFSVI